MDETSLKKVVKEIKNIPLLRGETKVSMLNTVVNYKNWQMQFNNTGIYKEKCRIHFLNSDINTAIKIFTNKNKKLSVFCNDAFEKGIIKENKTEKSVEDLIKQSNIYPCLMQENIFEKYYLKNIQENGFNSFLTVYIKNALLFKNDKGEIKESGEWKKFDTAITSFPESKIINIDNPKTFIRFSNDIEIRIRMFFNMAIKNNCDSAILICPYFREKEINTYIDAVKEILSSGYSYSFRELGIIVNRNY